MKQYLSLLCTFFCFTYMAFTQSKSNIKKDNYSVQIGNFKIVPAEQTVYEKEYTSGTDMDSDGNVIHWDGYRYVPSRTVNFGTTKLIVAGSIIFFKELFPIHSVDPTTLCLIFQSFGYESNYTYLLSPFENIVYLLEGDMRAPSKIDISGYTHIRQLLFKDERGKLFFIPMREGKLLEVDISLDEKSLQHTAGNFYSDKNGLYYLGENTRCQLEKSNGRNLRPILYEKYFVYGDAAYPYVCDADPKRFRLNAKTTQKVSTVYDTYLGDDSKIFKLSNNFSRTISPSLIKPWRMVEKGRPQAPFHKWQFIDILTVRGNKEGNTLYFSSPGHYANGGSYYTLIKTPSGFYGLTGSSEHLEAKVIDQVMIYDAKKKKHEPIEIEQYKRLTANFYLYKGNLYETDANLVETKVDIKKMKAILANNQKTDFYTDGKYLLGGYNLWHKEKMQEGRYKFSEPLFKDVDWETLHVVNEKMMIDKNNLYQESSSILKIIPLEKIEIPVLVILEPKTNGLGY